MLVVVLYLYFKPNSLSLVSLNGLVFSGSYSCEIIFICFPSKIHLPKYKNAYFSLTLSNCQLIFSPCCHLSLMMPFVLPSGFIQTVHFFHFFFYCCIHPTMFLCSTIFAQNFRKLQNSLKAKNQPVYRYIFIYVFLDYFDDRIWQKIICSIIGYRVMFLWCKELYLLFL